MRLSALSNAARLAVVLAATTTCVANTYAQPPEAGASSVVPASVVEAARAASASSPANVSRESASGHAPRLHVVTAEAISPAARPRAQGAARPAGPRGSGGHGPNGPYAAIDDPTLVTYAYDPDYTFVIELQTNQETHLVFAPDEEIVGVYLSNTGKRWLYHTSITKRDLFIEARLPGLHNAATIITTRRRYELDLRSSNAGHFDHRIAWEYADDAVRNGSKFSAQTSPFGTEYTQNVPGRTDAEPAANGLHVDLVHAHFDYKVEGDAPFTPTLVLDDGRFTYFQLPHDARLPAVLVMDAHGEGEITDLIPLGNDIYEVPQITEYGLLLRRDKDVVRILNENPARAGGTARARHAEGRDARPAVLNVYRGA
ncbi:TrbG/VirB9 family P-type conjugative transfer protein [Trinickia symbiotica]|uniref:TrbG/VirB9 family P-type conjugative transfer protein n=1 Tax=Trinickia symbiotica TaxID=863227 RepID=UPI00036299C4|nr:TrbG/VirB9 family P-type conjugative transfer protein [Trinickia symbiotica]